MKKGIWSAKWRLVIEDPYTASTVPRYLAKCIKLNIELQALDFWCWLCRKLLGIWASHGGCGCKSKVRVQQVMWGALQVQLSWHVCKRIYILCMLSSNTVDFSSYHPPSMEPKSTSSGSVRTKRGSIAKLTFRGKGNIHSCMVFPVFLHYTQGQ